MEIRDPSSLRNHVLIRRGLGLASAAMVAGAASVALLPGMAWSQGKAASGDTILIGHYGSLTGSEATFGQSTSNGIKLAIKEFNAAGGLNGRKVELKEYDTKGDPKEAGAVVQRLVSSDKVTAVLGEVASKLSLAGAPVCQEAGVPMITPSSTNPRVTKVGDMISRVCFIDPFQGSVCAKFAWETKKAKKVAILYDQQAPYSDGLAKEFKKAYEKLGGKVPSEQRYKAGDTDFTAQLTAIRGDSPDMIFIPGYYTDVGTIAKQCRKLGITCPLLGGDGWDSSELAKIGEGAIEGSFYSNHYAPQDPSPAIQGFIKKYQAEHGAIPDGLAALGYDAANMLFDAMKRSKTLGGKDLAAAIAATKNFKAVTGNITIDAERNSVKSAVIVEMKGGVPTYVTTIEPTKQAPVTDLLQILITAIAVGSLYALIALGYTMVYGILKFINFAHSDVVVLGAWISFTLSMWMLPALGVDAKAAPWWAGALVLILAMAVCAAVGFCIERLAYKPLRSAPRLNVLITAIGISLFLQNVGQLQWSITDNLKLPFGTRPVGMPALIPSLDVCRGAIHGVRVELVDVVIVVTAIALMTCLQFLVHRTKFGIAMRAVSFNTDSAALMGVPVNRVISITFMIGAALAAAAGFLFTMKYSTVQQTAHTAWVLMGLKAFVAAVVGGIGNIRGAVLGGFLIAFVEQYGEFFGAKYLTAGMGDIYVFLVLIIVLLARPTGILGSPVREKV